MSLIGVAVMIFGLAGPPVQASMGFPQIVDPGFYSLQGENPILIQGVAGTWSMSTADRLFCPICVREHRESRVTVGMAMRTALATDPGWYGEDGRFHSPRDPNWTTIQYHCSNGHTFERSSKPDCGGSQ